MIVRRYRLLEPGNVIGLKLPGELDGGRDLEGTVSVDHELDVATEPAARRHDPAHALGNREAVAADDAHLGRSEALGGIACELRLGLIAGCPTPARIASDRTAHRTKRLVERNTERLRLHIPHRDVDAGNRFHDDAAAPAFIGLRHAALERRRAARTVVHLLVDALGKHRILTDDLGRQLVLDDGCDDGRAPQRRADASEAAIGFNANERRVALDLRAKVGAMAPLFRDGRRHGYGGHFGNLHSSSLPGVALRMSLWHPYAVAKSSPQAQRDP